MAANTVILNVAGIRAERSLYSASLPVTPGMLLEYEGSTLTVEPSSVTNAYVRPVMIAVEEPENKGHGVTDPYTVAGEIVQVDFPGSGCTREMWLAAGENASAGSVLESDGHGNLKVGSTYGVVRALEAKTAVYTAVQIMVEVI